MDRIKTGKNMAANLTKASDIDYNGAQNQLEPRPQIRGTAQLAAGIDLLPTGGIFKSAAVEVLRREQRLMATGEICKLALEWGLLKCSGKTPEATMASSLYGDIKRNDGTSLFVRPRGGMFGLREWTKQEFVPPPPKAVPAAQQVIDGSQIYKKEKRQRKNASSSKPLPASKRQQWTAPPSPPAGKIETKARKLEMQGIQNNHGGANITIEQALQNSGQQNNNYTDKSSNYIINLERSATAVTPTTERPRQRLLNSESNEAPWTSACTTIVSNFSLPTSTVTAPAHTVTQGEDWFRALTEQEHKVAAVETTWGPLHPRAGQAHLLLYKACKQQALRFPSVESRAQTALTRAYDIMMFNTQVEELGKLQGVW